MQRLTRGNKLLWHVQLEWFYPSGDEIIANPHVLPATQISYTDGLELFTYVNSTSTPTASITHPTTQLGTKTARVMAAFSSIGPNTLTLEILKRFKDFVICTSCYSSSVSF
ncbi:subtilisin-like protease sbt5.4 [Nicotiana attenuata]|uniref:Subtilisin-like protease sbt5.4 n=1 Tax=Nicotiana attenuata TaxID=49451 RepID=A0A314LBN8_NICAT|nr:subtilisin-like protease sbt5.4 [Nicotiana attenuata]